MVLEARCYPPTPWREWKEFRGGDSGIVGALDGACLFYEKALLESQCQEQPGVGTWTCHPALVYRDLEKGTQASGKQRLTCPTKEGKQPVLGGHRAL